MLSICSLRFVWLALVLPRKWSENLCLWLLLAQCWVLLWHLKESLSYLFISSTNIQTIKQKTKEGKSYIIGIISLSLVSTLLNFMEDMDPLHSLSLDLMASSCVHWWSNKFQECLVKVIILLDTIFTLFCWSSVPKAQGICNTHFFPSYISPWNQGVLVAHFFFFPDTEY